MGKGTEGWRFHSRRSAQRGPCRRRGVRDVPGVPDRRVLRAVAVSVLTMKDFPLGEWRPHDTARCPEDGAPVELRRYLRASKLVKGDRVIVTGTLRQRDYEAQDKTKRTVWEVAVSEVGAALRYATVKISKSRRDSVPVLEDPWASGATPPEPTEDEPPF